MRADATRNLETLLETGARLLAEEPSATIASIAKEAGLDRRTVHRRFSCREALLDAVFQAKLDAVDEVLKCARLLDAPVVVALHRFVEGVVPVIRRYPIDPERMRDDAQAYSRMFAQRQQLAAFMERAVAEGLIRSDLPDGLAPALLTSTITLIAHQFHELEPAHAADIVVETLLSGIGRRSSEA
jgi:AcrR family transcriptional regulator